MNKLLRQLEVSIPASQLLNALQQEERTTPYDPEMLYVECSVCGRPVLWEAGRTTALLKQSDINPLMLDERCLILSDGCNICSPGEEHFPLNIVRLANISLSTLMLLQEPKGNA